MSMQLEDHGDHWVVKTVETLGRRRRMGRGPVVVLKGDDDALRAEIMRQENDLRARLGLQQPVQEPVV